VKGSTFRAMESVHEKLKCLNYGFLFVKELKQPPVSKDEFILPPMKNTGHQFSHYIQLIKWLLSLIVNSKNDDNIDIDEHSLLPSVTAASEFDKVDIYDDPNVIAQKLMLTLRELGYNMDFPITKLKQPYGEIATSVLNFLADMALHCKNFQFIVEPKYITSKKHNEEEEEEDDDDNNHSDEEEIIVTDEETFEDSNDSIELSYEITKFENDATNNRFTSHSQPTQAMISCNIDPIEWRTEVERVTPALEVQFDDNYENNDTATSTTTTTSLLQNDISNNSWRKQVINALTENEKIWSEMERSQAAFQRLSKESNRSLEMIGIKEQIINDKFKHITEEYKICCSDVVNL
jgi:estrogen-related receptor beta like 1